MKRTAIGFVLGLVLGALALHFRPGRPDAEPGDAHRAPEKHEGTEEKEEQGEAHSFVHHETNSTISLRLNHDTQALLGLTSAPIAALQWKPEIEAVGQVLDPAPLLALLTEATTAHLALETSTREVERLRLLARDQNASARALEAAEAALRRDQIAVASIGPRLINAWGPGLAAQADPPALAHQLARLEAAIVRVDVPFADLGSNTPAGARVAPLTDPDRPEPAEFLGPAPSADPRRQGRGLLLLQRLHPLPPGTAVKAWLALPGDPETGVEVPREAILWHEGGTIVYRQTDEETFVRTSVTRSGPSPGGWFVRTGLAAGDRVVIAGAQVLLSEELKGRGGEE